MTYRFIEDGHVSSPQGFRATGVSCGLKEIKARDLALVYSTKPAQAAAIFTRNAITAAPVYFDQAVLSRNRENIRAVLVNAGHANVATGQQGLNAAIDCAKIAADELEVPRDSVLLLSTGKIGMPLPMERLRGGIRRAASELDSGGGRRAATAILTTDTKPKDSALSFSLREGRSATIAGMAKGSRMVFPRSTTLLAVLTSDASVDARLLNRSLEQSVARSFGRLMVAGESSPNDTILLLANGAADAPPITDAGSREFAAWQESLDALCTDLAQQVVRDAVAGGKLIHVHVRGAATDEHAHAIARAVASSPEVRWACAHGSADWGGVLIAIGTAGVDIRPDLLEIRFGQVPVLREGVAVPFEQSSFVHTLSGSEIELVVDLHLGTCSETAWTGTGE